jgi:hypothetical protein
MEKIIEDLVKQVNLEVDPGLTYESTHFFKKNELIQEYKLEKTEDSKYNISIWLNHFDKEIIKDIFFPLIRFIQYKATFYTYEECSGNIIYSLISIMDNKKGFYCKITFKNK